MNLAKSETDAVVLQAAHERAIEALIVQVAWAIDHSDMEALVSCLHPDVVFVRPDGLRVQGPLAVRDVYAQRAPDRLTRHLVTQVRLSWSSFDRVEAHTSVLLWTGRRSDAATVSGRPADPEQKLGEHRDVLVFRDKRWLLLSRQSEFVFFAFTQPTRRLS